MQVRRFLKSNWPYIFMFLFVLVVSILLRIDKQTDRPDTLKRAPIHKIELLNSEKIQERQKKIENLLYTNPPLYLFLAALNLFILLLFLAGLYLDGLMIYKWRKKQHLMKRTFNPAIINWDFIDVIRVSVMFFAFAYVILFLESFLVRRIPCLDNRNFRIIFNTTVMDIAGIVFVLNFVILIYRQRLATIGISLKNFFRNVFYGICGYITIIPILFLIMVITLIILNLFKWSPPVQPIVDLLMKEERIHILVYSSLFAAVAGPIMEEIFFRGFMYSALKKHIGILWSCLVTALIFSFLHAHLVGIAPIMVLGILLAYLYEKTGSLVSSVTVHITHNLVSLGMVFLMKGMNF
ncbi:MAG: CPBP family intramembrane metalloprotease [Candidatus Omnitrophica bacterium]|nr:CPBP family intramembrane metalloprotease [Candidatus Omnitrophota bacterium]